MNDEIEKVFNHMMSVVTIKTCKERYPKETGVIDQFIERGATEKIIRNALFNKFGISPKSMWLANYATYQLDRKDLRRILAQNNESE